MNKIIVIVTVFFGLLLPVFLTSSPYITTRAGSGSGILTLLEKYKIDKIKENIELFKQINEKKLINGSELILNEKYILPIQVVKFDGKTIRSTLNISDYSIAKSIETYNLDVEAAKIKKDKYKSNGKLWIPVNLFKIPNYFKNTKIETYIEKKSEKVDYSFLIKDKDFKITNNKLKNHIFYLISGHGGPDPGAVCLKDGSELREHEYAYDVTIRLAKKLLESNATVYMIVQDSADGIRDMRILNNGGNERLINGDTISAVQTPRLKQRTDLVNDFAAKNKKQKQMLLELHVDSRLTDKRIDIFFYYRNGCKQSEKLSNIIFETIRKKYNKSQPGRGYAGNVSSRDLFTLRNTAIPATYIELGNIQNPADQIRLLDPNNRQAVANWIFDGIISYYKK